MKSIKICFEYLLKDNTIIYFDELVDRKKYPWIRSSIDQLSRNWFIIDGIDSTLYNNLSVGQIISYELFNSNINIIVFIMMLFSIKPKNIDIYKSKNFDIEPIYVEILEKLDITYNVCIIDGDYPQELAKMSESTQESILKYFVRNAIIFINNIVKNNSKTQKCYFQGYSSTLDLIDVFDNSIVTDQLPKKFKNIFSIAKPLYFVPKTTKKDKKVYSLNINTQDEVLDVIKELFYKHYQSVKNELHLMIDSVIKKSEKFNIRKAILMHPEGRMPSILKQYLNNINGSVVLYNHGVIVYTHQLKELSNINAVLSWSEYETKFYKSIGMEVFKTGYPKFIDIQKDKKKHTKNNFFDSNILILALVPDERYDFTRVKIIDTNKKLINMLIDMGFKKENISFKIHPGRANLTFYQEVYKEELLAQNILKNVNIVNAINDSDLIIGGASTVIYEASFLNKPYYTYDVEPDILVPTEKTIFHEEYIYAVSKLDLLKENILNRRSQDIDYFIDNALYKNTYEDVKNIIYKNIINKTKEII